MSTTNTLARGRRAAAPARFWPSLWAAVRRAVAL